MVLWKWCPTPNCWSLLWLFVFAFVVRKWEAIALQTPPIQIISAWPGCGEALPAITSIVWLCALGFLVSRYCPWNPKTNSTCKLRFKLEIAVVNGPLSLNLIFLAAVQCTCASFSQQAGQYSIVHVCTILCIWIIPILMYYDLYANFLLIDS